MIHVKKGEGVGDKALLHTHRVRARVHSQYYTAHIGTAACPLLPLLYCHRPKTILAFPVASGLLKAGPVGPKPSTFHAESSSITFVMIRLTVSEIISHKVKPKRIL